MDRIVSFEDFRKKAGQIAEEDHNETPGAKSEGTTEVKTEGNHEGREKSHYMFFQNLASIKHYIEEIHKMNPDDIDALLSNGHDWAADHIATSKDDIQEVAEWIRNEMEDAENQGMDTGDDYDEEEMIEPENIEVEVVDNGEEAEGEEEKEEEEDEDNEDEE